MAGAKARKRDIAVFIASPGDLGPERQQFRETIGTLNTGFGDGAGVLFESLVWEDTLSSVGVRNQSVINQEIDRCDVFILALNRRWGQAAPDSSYSSYTEEEFHRALARFDAGGTPTIFVFFKRVDPKSEGDPGPQLTKVMAFRQSLEDTHQVLSRYFDDIDSFAGEVDKHLRAFARGELPKIEETTGLTLLPLNAVEAIQEAKQAAQIAQKKAEESQEQVNIESTRAEALALQLAEDAAEASLDGKFEKARQRFAQAIVGTTNPEILSHAFKFYYRTGDLESAVEVGERWQAATEPHSNHRAAAYCILGVVHRTRGELDQAVEMYEKALALNTELGHKEGMASNYGNLGVVHQTRGELDQAVEMYERALALDTELGSKEGMASAYGSLGNVHRIRGELEQAVRMYKKSLAIDTELGHKEGMAINYGNLGNVHVTRGELDQAVKMYEKALALSTDLGSKEGMASACGNLGSVYVRRGELEQAVRMYKKSLAIETELGRKEGMANDYCNLGIVHKSRGELGQAVKMYEKALALNTELGSKEGMASVYSNLGNVHVMRDEMEQAVEMYERALALDTELGSKEGMAFNYYSLGSVHETRGELDQARKVWAIALGLFEELGSPEAATVRQCLSEIELKPDM